MTTGEPNFFKGIEKLLAGYACLPPGGVEALGRLPFHAAVELAKQHATGNHETWAEALNVGVSTVARAFAGNHADRDYFVSFRSVPMLCVGMRSPFLLFWAMARFFHLAAAEGLDISGGPAVDPARAMQYLARMTREMSEAIDAVAKGAADGKWTLEEVRECEREVGDLLMLCHALLAGFGRLRAGMECD